MVRLLFCLVGGLALAWLAHSHPCDKEHEEHCAMEGPDTLKACLEKQTLGDECKKWVDLHDTCAEDLGKHCSGNAMTNDAEVCLNSWVPPENLNAGCRELLPKKEEPKEVEMTEAQKKRSAKRKAIREKAAKAAKAEKTKAEKKDKKKKKKSKKTKDDL